MTKRNWIMKDENIDNAQVENTMNSLGCGWLLASVLASRGITDKNAADFFLDSSFVEWNDPRSLPDMEKALNRVKLAKARGEHVTVFGDYDADGVTGTVIMVKALRKFGLMVDKYIPNRFTEGYGMSMKAIDEIYARGTKLIVTVDCGISCVEEINYAKGLGIDTVVTDHHTCPDIIPDCCAVVNPKRPDSKYAFPYLAGAGVAYKFACILLGEDCISEFLQLAAVGTVADVVQLTGENRKIVTEGLKEIERSPIYGIDAVFSSSYSKEKIDATSLAFILSPRINCAGRMSSSDIAYELLFTENRNRAEEIAGELNALNRKRQELEQKIFDEALNIIKTEELYNDEIIIVYGDNWNIGVIGIVASKITDLTNKPCILVSFDENGVGRGSGRSHDSFNLYEAVKSLSEYLKHFGGHALAIGLNIARDNAEIFREKLKKHVKDNILEIDKIRKLEIDSRIYPETLNVRSVEELDKLEPCGMGNPKPVFAFINAKISDIRLLSEGKHLKLTLTKNGFSLDAVAFKMGNIAKKLYQGMTVHAAGNLTINDYNGKIQMIVKDILY